jgi:hypothetical protein
MRHYTTNAKRLSNTFDSASLVAYNAMAASQAAILQQTIMITPWRASVVRCG